MKRLNEEFQNWKKYGRNGRTDDQIVILKSYQILILEGTGENIYMIGDELEGIYMKLTDALKKGE